MALSTERSKALILATLIDISVFCAVFHVSGSILKAHVASRFLSVVLISFHYFQSRSTGHGRVSSGRFLSFQVIDATVAYSLISFISASTPVSIVEAKILVETFLLTVAIPSGRFQVFGSDEARGVQAAYLAGLTFVALVSSANAVGLMPGQGQSAKVENGILPYPARMQAYQQRYEKLSALSKDLMPENGVAGYISDIDPDRMDITDPISGYENRLYAQYAIAPVLLVPPPPIPKGMLSAQAGTLLRPPASVHVDPKIYVGDFIDYARAPEIIRRQDLEMVRDYGNGVMILRKP